MKVSPSLLSLNFLQLETGIRFFDQHSDMLHVDIMDGHFVKNITLAPLLIQQIRHLTTLPIEAHLMMTDPEVLIENCAEAGADYITVHVEAVNGSAVRIIDLIRDKYGRNPGIAVNPETPLCAYDMLLEYVDLVNFMTIDPGFPGTRFVSPVLDKIRDTDALRAKKHLSFLIQVDGSVGPKNYQAVKESGADVIVAGEPTLFQLDAHLPTAWEKMEAFVCPK